MSAVLGFIFGLFVFGYVAIAFIRFYFSGNVRHLGYVRSFLNERYFEDRTWQLYGAFFGIGGFIMIALVLLLAIVRLLLHKSF